ncbi:ABC transporter permease [Terriglobus saanensis]|uniref:Permease n=1 Tax=Terriglobus saanensis (strain ATCC BAA-1853 / DSM 23119 / SP1PR4) TaxID=401053 RepID=E8UZR7_TERSS|nr:ABC transporter permease [Terriglobus saanensis]ADV84410.1 permease [Terriglobus saanensis SP1PR4]
MNRYLSEVAGRMKSIFRREQLKRELTEELAFHQTMLRERLLREGATEQEVDAAARRTFGNPSRWKERLSELRQFQTVENLLRDLRFSARMLKKAPAFAAVAVLTLALGVGANTAVFSLINGLLLRPLPVPESEQLAVLRYEEGGPQPGYDFNTPFFRSLEKRHEVFSQVFAFNGDTLQVRGESGNENVPGVLVSGQFFQALETAPLLGRYLTPGDDQPGGSPAGLAVVISEHFWETRFGRASNAVGQQLVIANVPFTVVGVMPKSFIGADPTLRPEIFAPLSADPVIDAPRNHIDAGVNTSWLTVMARLQPGVGLEKANAALLTYSGAILHESDADGAFIAEMEKAHFRVEAETGSRGFTYARALFRKPLVAMASMCGGVLLLACLNLAGLLMARSAARERELSTRLAVGGTRGRLIQQLLVESMLIAVLGTSAGLAMAPAVSRSLAALIMSGNSMSNSRLQLDTSLDLRVFVFAAIIAIVATVLIGLLPALRATGNDLSESIKGQHAATQGQKRRGMLPQVLLASEVALALVLVVGAGLLATSMVRLFQSGVGFDPKGLVNVAFKMDKQSLEGDALTQVYQQLGEDLKRQPNVKSVSFEFIVPLSGRGWNGKFAIPGQSSQLLFLNSVGPDYFGTMRIPVEMGREFRWTDTKSSGLKIILNESAAKLLFPGSIAVGKQVVREHDHASMEVVAVVGDAKYRNLRRPAPPAAYVPIQQDDAPKQSLTAVLRVNGSLTPLASALRPLTARLAPTIPAPVLTTVDEVITDSMSAEWLMAILSIFFAGCALLVTGIGLYGTLAYATARRTSEIGIRMALGAERGGVVAMIFRENALVATVGCGAGLVVAVLASKVLASFLYGTTAHDPMVFVGSVAALIVLASAASILPAIRAARIEPATAIRGE